MSDQTFEQREVGVSSRLFVHRTHRFKTAAVKWRLVEPLDEAASQRALLAGLLRRGTQQAPNLQAITRRLEHLYGAGMTLDLVRIGERQATDCSMQFVHTRGRGLEDVLPEALRFQRELITSPHLEAGGFPESEFEQERRNLEFAIRAVADDKASYAHQRLVEIAFADEPYARADHGSLADVAALERHRVAQYHGKRLAENAPTLFAIGDFDADDEARLVEFAAGLGASHPTSSSSAVVVPTAFPQHDTTESVAAGQSHLLIAHRFDPRRRTREQAIAFSLATTLLGGGAHSLLFREVREKAGLCYSTHASLDRQKGFMLCYAGIARRDASRVADLMRLQLKRVRNGDFDDAALEAARSALAHSVRTAFDSPWRALDFAARADATGWPIDTAVYLETIERCDARGIQYAANEFTETVCYLAAGVDDETSRE